MVEIRKVTNGYVVRSSEGAISSCEFIYENFEEAVNDLAFKFREKGIEEKIKLVKEKR